MKAIWTRLALDSEDKIIEYLKVRWTDKVLAEYLDKLEQIIISLEHDPYMGSVFEIKPKYRNLLVTKHTYLIYQVDEELQQIVLLLFWPTSQDPEKLKMLFT